MKTPFLCPICREVLTGEKVLSCVKGHSYDVSTEGYINLAVGKSSSGDSKEMCRARRDFLAKGYYEGFAEGICDAISVHGGCGKLLDAGCGEGYYLRKIKERFPSSVLTGVDLAKESVRLASKAEKQSNIKIDYTVAGIFDMPIADKSYDTVISVFAPVPDIEAKRVLMPEGKLVVCHPGEKHLFGMKKILYKNPYDNEEKPLFFDGFKHLDDRRVKYSVFVEKTDVLNLFMMTPYYWKTSREDAERLLLTSGFETELDFIISVFKLK